jgi:hypothetical protein
VGLTATSSADDGAPEEDAQRDERVADRGRVDAVHEPIDEGLHICAMDVGEAHGAEDRIDPQAQRLLVATDDAGLVDVARAVADRAGARAGQPEVGRVTDGRRQVRAELALAQGDQRLRPPGLRRGQRRERPAQLAAGRAGRRPQRGMSASRCSGAVGAVADAHSRE